jgi:hypothetical protein
MANVNGGLGKSKNMRKKLWEYRKFCIFATVSETRQSATRKGMMSNVGCNKGKALKATLWLSTKDFQKVLMSAPS